MPLNQPEDKCWVNTVHYSNSLTSRAVIFQVTREFKPVIIPSQTCSFNLSVTLSHHRKTPKLIQPCINVCRRVISMQYLSFYLLVVRLIPHGNKEQSIQKDNSSPDTRSEPQRRSPSCRYISIVPINVKQLKLCIVVFQV